MSRGGLSDRDLVLFARDSVTEDSRRARDEAGRARRLAAASRVARSFQAAAEAAVRDSGYRVTARVRNGIAAELARIESEAKAPTATVGTSPPGGTGPG